ncbi:MAG: hypothetical protein ACJ8HC_26090, partial [Paraburkholderia graminis]|uniref:hypothetical protein n=1 Tax=Paraburkholderia graminis TaxID=60548 RepID=UPI00389A3146
GAAGFAAGFEVGDRGRDEPAASSAESLMRGPLFEVVQCGFARCARGASHASAPRAPKMDKKIGHILH